MWLVTVTVNVSSDVTDVWLSDVIINPNPPVLKIEKEIKIRK